MYFRNLSLAVTCISLGAGTTARGADHDNKKARPSFERLVVVGDSLSAGFQNFSLYDSSSVQGAPLGGQTRGYPALIAQQAGVALTLPRISFPGIPAALALTPSGIVRLSGIGARINPAEQVTNLSVPGFLVADVLARPFPGNPAVNLIDALSDVILGSPGVLPGCGPYPVPPDVLIVSQVTCAAALRPTAILVSIGNNDALQALTLGVPPTDTATFSANLYQLLNGLRATNAQIVMANIPDVTEIPFLLSVPAFRARCGFAPVGVSNSDYVVPDIANPLLKNINVCVNYSVRPAALVLSAKFAVERFNEIIEDAADQYDVEVVDVNGLFADIGKKGYTVGGQKLTTNFLGGIFSLDGIHPTNTGHAILANLFIKTMNSRLGAGISPVSVEQVAKTDPLTPKR